MAKAPEKRSETETPVEPHDAYEVRESSPSKASLSTGRYEPRDLAELMKYCKIVIKSDLCPRHIKSPADAMLIIQRGAELGLSAVNALQNLNVINGKVAMPAALAVGVVKASEACEYFTCIESTDEYSTWETKRRGNPEPTRYTFSKHDAQVAGLWGHGTWKKYPRNLLAARASMNLARMEYQDVLVGVYTPEEMESVDRPAPTADDRTSAEGERAPMSSAEPVQAPVEESDEKGEPQTGADEQAGSNGEHETRHWSERTVEEATDRSETKAWQKQNERFHGLMRINDVQEHCDAFRDFIKERHSVSSWTHIPADLLTRWCDLIVTKSPTPSDDKPSDRAAWVERKLTRHAQSQRGE